MKQIITLLTLFAVCISLSACKSGGKTNNAEVDYGDSSKFSEEEIKSAVEAVLIKFKDFEGCDLKKIWYDEVKSESEIDSYLSNGRGHNNGAEQENVIVLSSEFYVDSTGGDGGFNPDTTYSNWSWILIRDGTDGKWIVDDWGY